MVTMETPHLLVEGACSRSWYRECANRTVPVYQEQTFHNVSCSAFYLNGISCFFFFLIYWPTHFMSNIKVLLFFFFYLIMQIVYSL